MIGPEESSATTVCKACGLCCTGHLFIWAKLRSSELDGAEPLGLVVHREPHQRGFNQPCPLWDGVCTIYDNPKYPRFCRTYKCKLLKQLLDEKTTLPCALTVVQQTISMIHGIEPLLPASTNPNFRERLSAKMKLQDADSDFRSRAEALVVVIEQQFGVKNFLDE